MRKLVALIGCASLLVLALAVVARAVPPERSPVEHVDDTFTIPAGEECAFPVEVHVVGDVRDIQFLDREGNVIRSLHLSANFRVTFSANGKSITTVSVAPAHFTFNPDGSVVLAVTGLQGHLILGGGPPQAADVGRIVFLFREDAEPEILFEAGNFNMGPFPQLCDVLADP